jgi:hypothetical protein
MTWKNISVQNLYCMRVANRYEKEKRKQKEGNLTVHPDGCQTAL